MIYLNLEELMLIGTRTLGSVEVRDVGLLESALARPAATAFGEDAYFGIHEKAAALTHSLARNHALVDGNRPLALAALISFYGMNGLRLTWDNDEAHDVIVSIASGERDEVAVIAEVFAASTEPWETP